MKVKIVWTLLLLVFSLCSIISIAQLATTEEDARNDRDKANKKWQDAIKVRVVAYEDYNESDKVRSYLQTVSNDIDLENRGNLEDLKEGAVEIVADLASIAATRGREIPLSSLSASVLNGIADVADWRSLKNQKSNIDSALSAESANTAMLQSAWQSAQQTENALKEKYDAAYAHWLTFVPCPGCNMRGADHPPHASCWNLDWGCSETDVRICTHNCDYTPIFCRGCRNMIPKEKHQSAQDKALHKEILCSGCNYGYYLCNSYSLGMHRLRVCGQLDYYGNYFFVPCGNSYRDCTKRNIICRASGTSGYCDDGGAYDNACPAYSGPSHTCDICNSGGGTDTNNFEDPANNGNPVGNDNGDTTVERCGRSDCNEILSNGGVVIRDRAEHEYVTCGGCGVGYYKCDSTAAYDHAQVACRRATCPRKRGTGTTNLWWTYRCQPNPSGIDNPFSCDGGLPHDLQ
ncbi:hypothetical protein C6501_11875 [Candidatus Poribacteria bacterium]|nr:MAG: hypothetical protein C6501_11875 [Candidatus Poribacteria bacterium]